MTVREPVVPSLAFHSKPADAAPRRLPRSLRTYLAILLLFSLGNSSDAFLLLRARDLGVPVASLPLLWTTLHVAKLVSSYLGGDWSDRIARTKLIVSGWMVYAATYLAFGVATEPWHAWALFTVYGTYYGLTEPAEKELVKDLAPARVQGRAYGFYNFVIGVSAIPAGVLTGWLWQTFGPGVALSTGAAIAAASSVALIVWAQSRAG
jgi:MFS family permease